MTPKEKLREIKDDLGTANPSLSAARLRKIDIYWLINRIEQLEIALGHVHSCGRCEQCAEVATQAYTTGPKPVAKDEK